MTYSWVPTLGLVLYLLKNSASDFFRFHQSHRQSLSKLQSLDQLPPEELKEVTRQLTLPHTAVSHLMKHLRKKTWRFSTVFVMHLLAMCVQV